MPYQTGVYTDPNDLLSILRSTALAAGWSENGYSAEATGYRLHIVKNGVYLNFRSCVNEAVLGGSTNYYSAILLSGSTGYDAGEQWWDQPGATGGPAASAFSHLVDTGGLYHIHSLADSIAVFAEGDSQWSQIIFGRTHLGYGTYHLNTTGAYASGSSGNYNTVMRRAGNTNVDKYCRRTLFNGVWTGEDSILTTPPVSNSDGLITETSNIHWTDMLVKRAQNQLRGNAILFPSYLAVAEGTYESTYVGHIEGLKVLAANVYNDGEQIQYGTDQYIVSKVCPNSSSLKYLGVAALITP